MYEKDKSPIAFIGILFANKKFRLLQFKKPEKIKEFSIKKLVQKF